MAGASGEAKAASAGVPVATGAAATVGAHGPVIVARGLVRTSGGLTAVDGVSFAVEAANRHPH